MFQFICKSLFHPPFSNFHFKKIVNFKCLGPFHRRCRLPVIKYAHLVLTDPHTRSSLSLCFQLLLFINYSFQFSFFQFISQSCQSRIVARWVELNYQSFVSVFGLGGRVGRAGTCLVPSLTILPAAWCRGRLSGSTRFLDMVRCFAGELGAAPECLTHVAFLAIILAGNFIIIFLLFFKC